METRKSIAERANVGEAFVKRVAERYDRCHPGDSFGDLVRRSSFSKEDRRMMEDWLEAGRGWRRP